MLIPSDSGHPAAQENHKTSGLTSCLQISKNQVSSNEKLKAVEVLLDMLCYLSHRSTASAAFAVVVLRNKAQLKSHFGLGLRGKLEGVFSIGLDSGG